MTWRAKVWMLVAVASTLSAAAIAADLEIAPPRKPAPSAAPVSANPFAPPDAACLEWTDDCRVCQKSATGEASCSNVGAACVAKAPRCTRR